MGTSQSTRIPSRTSLVKSLIAHSLLPDGNRAAGLRGLDDRLQHGDVGRRLLAADLGPTSSGGGFAPLPKPPPRIRLRRQSRRSNGDQGARALLRHPPGSRRQPRGRSPRTRRSPPARRCWPSPPRRRPRAYHLGGGLRPPSETSPQDSIAPAKPALERRSRRPSPSQTPARLATATARPVSADSTIASSTAM